MKSSCLGQALPETRKRESSWQEKVKANSPVGGPWTPDKSVMSAQFQPSSLPVKEEKQAHDWRSLLPYVSVSVTVLALCSLCVSPTRLPTPWAQCMGFMHWKCFQHLGQRRALSGPLSCGQLGLRMKIPGCASFQSTQRGPSLLWYFLHLGSSFVWFLDSGFEGRQ